MRKDFTIQEESTENKHLEVDRKRKRKDQNQERLIGTKSAKKVKGKRKLNSRR